MGRGWVPGAAGWCDDAALDDDEFVDLAPPFLPAIATVAEVAELLLGTKLGGIPLVDHNGSYAGLVTARRVAMLVRPTEPREPNASPNLTFIGDALAMLAAGWMRAGARPATAVVDEAACSIVAPASLDEAVRLIARGQPAIAVIEPASRSLLGLATAERVLAVACRRR